MRGAIFAALIACLPVQAWALSCMPHSVEAAFAQAQEDAARFVIVRGRLDFDPRQLPKAAHSPRNVPPEVTMIEAELIGTSLSQTGFATPFARHVTLAVSCFGPWCAHAQRGVEVLAFVRSGAQGDLISTNPCGGYLFDTPTPRMIRAVKSCFAGQACVPALR